MTSSGQVLFAAVVLDFGLRLFDCQHEPVGPVSDPRENFSSQAVGESWAVIRLSLKHDKLEDLECVIIQ